MAAFYHGTIKQLIVAFNGYFSNIHVVRRKGDSVAGEPIKDIRVPIAFSNRAKWLHQIIEGTREKQVKITLPRIGFEISSFAYDASRKKNRNQEVKCTDEYGNTWTVKNPVPWNIEISMYIVSDNQEDGLQIVEQILPQFNPDLTISFKSVLGINTNVPISLNSCSMQDDYEGAMTEDRLVVYTLTFTAKLELYGEVIYQGVVKPPSIDIGGGDDDGDGDGSDDGGTISIVIDGTGPRPAPEYKSPHVYLNPKNTNFR